MTEQQEQPIARARCYEIARGETPDQAIARLKALCDQAAVKESVVTHPWYDVVIRRELDGVERTYRMKCEWNPNLFWWTRGEGNGGCDCNRGDFFDRAGGEDEDDDRPCDHAAYSVLRFILPDGTVVQGPD